MKSWCNEWKKLYKEAGVRCYNKTYSCDISNIKLLLNQGQHHKHLTRAKEKFAFHFSRSGGRVERFEVTVEVPLVCDDWGCHVICGYWSVVHDQVRSQYIIYDEILNT